MNCIYCEINKRKDYLLYILTSVWVLRTQNARQNLHFQQKKLKMKILTSFWGAQHPKAGRNIQQLLITLLAKNFILVFISLVYSSLNFKQTSFDTCNGQSLQSYNYFLPQKWKAVIQLIPIFCWGTFTKQLLLPTSFTTFYGSCNLGMSQAWSQSRQKTLVFKSSTVMTALHCSV